MQKSKLGTIFLLILMLFTLTISVGCGKDNDEPKNNGDKSDVVDKEEKKDTQKNEGTSTTKKVKLLKRNGVEWKENTRINSHVGAKKYTVVWGDTLSLIARTWKVNCYKLAKYNHIKNIDRIEVGQVIYNYAAK